MPRNFPARDGTVLDLDDRNSIIDYVIAKLEEQGERCATFSSCEYRNKLGHACAVGWLLTDPVAKAVSDAGLNNFSFIEVLDKVPEAHDHFSELTDSDRFFFVRMQTVHDSKTSWSGEGSIRSAYEANREYIVRA